MEGCNQAEAKLQALQDMAQAAVADRDAAMTEYERLLEQQGPRASESGGQVHAELATAQRRCQNLEADLQALQDFYAGLDEDKNVLQRRCARCVAADSCDET